MDDQPSIMPRRGRIERKDLVGSSSSSSPPWTMLMSAYFFFFFFFHSFLTLSVAQETEPDLFTPYNNSCGGDSVQDTSAFQANKVTLFNSLREKSSSYLYSFYRTTYQNEDLQGFYQCRGDLTLDLCNQCVSMVTNGTQKNKCGSTMMSFRMDTGGCSVLYVSAKNNITSNSFTYLWSLAQNSKAVALSGFGPARDMLLANLSSVAPSDPTLFAHSHVTYASNATVYALVQCFRVLKPLQCAQCLSLMTSSVILDTLVNATEGLIYYGSCFAQFSSSPFYSGANAIAASETVPAGSKSTPQEFTSTSDTCMLPLAIGFGLGSLLVITLLVLYQRHPMHNQKVGETIIGTKGFLFYPNKNIENAFPHKCDCGI